MKHIQNQNRPPRGWIRVTALLLAAVAGAAVMVVELGVARILTPVFGGSISVWAIVIATTMLALAAGYAFGGYRADRTGGVIVACRAASIGAVLCALIPYVREPLIMYTIDLATLTGATLMAITLIAPSLFFLSQVSPALIRGLTTEAGGQVGVTAGGIYAVSTVGSLVGTLAAVWLFLYFPLVLGFIATALLVLIPVVILRPRAGAAGLVIGGILFGFAVTSNPEVVTAQDQYGRTFVLLDKRKSPYGEIRVVGLASQYRYMIVNGFDQGGIDLETGESAYTFTDGLVDLGSFYAGKPSSVLVIGLGPGIIADQLRAAGVRVDVVEIDAEVYRVARDYFDYTGDVAIDDGRRFLQRSDRSWDLIIVDAFSGGNPPWQLYTKEAFALYRNHLNPGGTVVLNFIGSHLDPGQRGALEAVVTTAEAVFPTVDAYPDPWEADDYPTRNILIAASLAPRRESLHSGDPLETSSITEALARSRPAEVMPGRILTDGSAPLEPLVRRTAQILRNRIREFIPVAVLIR
jgi:spermidine synthase